VVPEGLISHTYVSSCMDHVNVPYDKVHKSWTLKTEVLGMPSIETWKTYAVEHCNL